jgi:N-acetylmuramoyl-L-alanine amidase
MEGYLDATDSWFKQTASQVSSHYGIGLNGDVHQYVELQSAAWANGILEAGHRWPGPAGVNPNQLSVSIETEDQRNTWTPVSANQYASTLFVCRKALETYPRMKYLVAHRAISPLSRTCPGQRWMDEPFWTLAQELGLTGIS